MNIIDIASKLIKLEAKVLEARANLITNNLNDFIICLLQLHINTEELIKELNIQNEKIEYSLAIKEPNK